MAIPKNESQQQKPNLNEQDLSVLDKNHDLEERVIKDNLEKKDFDPTKDKLAWEFPEFFYKKNGETTAANPITKKHLEHEAIEEKLASAKQAQETGKKALKENTNTTKEQLVTLFPAIAPTDDTIKATNKEPKKESLKTSFLDKEPIDSIDNPEQYAA